ncbi:MAG TPA: cytochrome c [Nitrospira sp.]|nr:cytochrome c [Nitrospira sp.]
MMASIFNSRSRLPKRAWTEKGLCLVLLLGVPGFSNAAQDIQPDDQDLIRGKKIFMKYCSACHGASGQGEGYRLLGPDPADLTSQATRQQSDADLLRTIHEGKPNMPVWKYRLSQRDSRNVLAYIRSLQE